MLGNGKPDAETKGGYQAIGKGADRNCYRDETRRQFQKSKARVGTLAQLNF